MCSVYSNTTDYTERAWIYFIASLRIEDGLRYVLDNELELHDQWVQGLVSVAEISRLARDHWVSLTATA